MHNIKYLQGLIDATKEVKKLEDKKTRLQGQFKKLEEAAAKPDYTTKVPENVRTQNATKVSTLRLPSVI